MVQISAPEATQELLQVCRSIELTLISLTLGPRRLLTKSATILSSSCHAVQLIILGKPGDEALSFDISTITPAVGMLAPVKAFNAPVISTTNPESYILTPLRGLPSASNVMVVSLSASSIYNSQVTMPDLPLLIRVPMRLPSAS